MNVDTPAPLGLSLVEVENQRTTKHPRMSGFNATQLGVDAIQKITERELHRLEAMVGVLFTLGLHNSTLKPFDLPFVSRDRICYVHHINTFYTILELFLSMFL